MKPKSYYDGTEAKYGLTARRAAESADVVTDQYERGGDFAKALRDAAGGAYRPGKLSGR